MKKTCWMPTTWLSYIYIISLLKKTCERYQILSKEEIEKNNNMVVKDIKIFQKSKNKSLLSIGKKYEKEWENENEKGTLLFL